MIEKLVSIFQLFATASILGQAPSAALRMIKELCKRLERQKQQGLKSHLDAK